MQMRDFFNGTPGAADDWYWNVSCIWSLWVIFLGFSLGLGGFGWVFLGLHKGISSTAKGNVRKQQRFCQKKSKHITSCNTTSFICPLAQTGVQWDVRRRTEFDFLSASASEAGPASPVPGCCLSDEVPVDTLREDPNFHINSCPTWGTTLLPSSRGTPEVTLWFEIMLHNF